MSATVLASPFTAPFGSRGRSAGFSLLELMTVVAVLGIMSVLAFTGLQYLQHSTQVKAASTTIYAALLKARSEAVKRNSTVTLTPTGGNWQAGWTLTDSSGNVLVNQDALKGVVVTSNVTTNLIYLSSGRIQGGVSPQFSVTHSSAATDRTERVGRCISASPNGTPYVKPTTCS